jgi:agmatinase
MFRANSLIQNCMSYRELYVSPSAVFSGYQKTFDEAEYVVLGVPFDVTSTYRTGARFAPSAIREASLNIETYSFRAGVDVEDLRLHDLGDLHTTGNVDETLKRLEQVMKELVDAKKIPVLIGGEHTITLGATKALDKNVAIVSFDAHLDLRNEYMNLKTSHTTFMRRINEQVQPYKVLEIGTRAVCKEELDYARKARINFTTVQQIRNEGVEKTIEKIEKLLGNAKKIYVTIDMDVLDPAFVPAVQNPEPDGFCTSTFYDILSKVCDKRLIAFDVVEVAPHYDNGVTAIQAAKTIFEALCYIEQSRRTNL